MTHDDANWSRRRFLQTGAGGASLVAACSSEDTLAPDVEPATPDADAGGPHDAASDAASLSDAAAPSDAAPSADIAPDAVVPDGLPVEPAPVRIKGPYLQIRNGALAWRVETQGSTPLSLTASLDGQRVAQAVTEVTEQDVAFMWPPAAGLRVDNRDEPGRYAVHVATLPELTPGSRIDWTIEGLAEGPVTGTARVPTTTPAAFTAAWVSDTMFPVSVTIGEGLASENADLLLHGGDIQYQSNPLDTWNGYFLHFGAAMRHAPMHYCIGNHEYEDLEEIDAIYGRLLGLQGDGTDVGYHAFTWGGWRFVLLNSEVEFGVDGAQMQWLESELSATDADPERFGAVVAFHRPYFTFGRSRPNVAVREVVHGILARHDVALVLTGHNHCYERFEVDGITYIVDGGGGAGLYDPNDSLEEIAAARPDEPALRQTFERSHGWLRLQFDDRGSISGVRTNDRGEVSDTFVLGGA